MVAVQKYPQLGVKDSAFNKRFLEAHTERQSTAPEFFKNPQWPLMLAEELAEQSPDFLKIKALAEQRDAEAQEKLGYSYVTGSGVRKNVTEAARWYRKAAEQGNAGARYNLV